MRIRNRILLVTVGFLAVLTAVFTILLQQVQQHTFIKGTEHELRTAALMARELLPPGYHERIVDKTSVSDEEFQGIVERFNQLCVKSDLEYLWSLMVLDGRIVFTSSTSPGKDARKRDHAGFLEPHSNPELYQKAFSTMQPEFKANEDKWGRIQVVLIPFRDGRGRPCLMGASRSMRELDARLNETLLSSLFAGGLILVLGACACLYLAHSISKPVEEVTRAAAAIAKGDLSHRVEVRGGQELELLAGSINAMTQAIRERVQAVAESEQRFSVFLSNLPAAAFIKSAEGRILLANQYQRSLVGGKDSWSNKRFEDLLPPEVAARMSAEDRRALAEGLTVVEEEVSDAQGQKHMMETHRFPIPLPGGTKLLGGIALNITKRKQLEEHLRRSQKIEAIGQLAGGVAHDFNNLLVPILGYSEMLLATTPDGDPQKTRLEQIHKAALRAQRLTQQLLAFGRKSVLSVETFGLSTMVGNFQQMLKRLLREDIVLRLDLASDAGLITADPFQIEQILMNLVVNARDAMPQGGKITVTTANAELDEAFCRTHPGTSSGRYAMLSVTDTGIGMSPEVQSRLFEPFFTTKAVGKGTGLGLSTVFGIVQQHGGSIWVTSAVGKGSTFTIYIPRSKATTSSLEATVADETALHGRETVLMVEDDEAVREFTCTVLKQLGYKVLSAARPEEALKLIEPPDVEVHLLLTDVIMPGMDGRQLFERVQKVRPGLKVLFISGYTGDAISDHGIREEGLNLLQKPFAIHALGLKVRTVLDSPAPVA